MLKVLNYEVFLLKKNLVNFETMKVGGKVDSKKKRGPNVHGNTASVGIKNKR